MKRRLFELDEKWKGLAKAGCLCILFFFCLSNIGSIWGAISSLVKSLRPVIIGAIVAYIVNPLQDFFYDKVLMKMKKEKTRNFLSIIFALILVFGLLAVGAASLIPQTVSAISSLISNLQDYLGNLDVFLDGLDGPLANAVHDLTGDLTGVDGLITRAAEYLAGNLDKVLSATTSIGGSAANVAIGFIFAIYFLFAEQRIVAGFNKLLSLVCTPLQFKQTKILLEKFHTIFTKYIACEIIDAMLVGFLTYIFMLIMGMPNALLVSLIAGVTNLIPTFGPIAGAVLSAFILLLVSPSQVIPYLIFAFLVQLLDGYVIKSRLFGEVLNVPGLIILIAIVCLGNLMGVGGMLIAIPVAAIAVYLYSEIFLPWLQLKKDLAAYTENAILKEKKETE